MPATSDTLSCKQPAGVVAPVIDSARCEGKADCLRVCPYDVFEVRALSGDERRALPLVSRFKIWAHGGRQAFVLNGMSGFSFLLRVPDPVQTT